MSNTYRMSFEQMVAHTTKLATEAGRALTTKPQTSLKRVATFMSMLNAPTLTIEQTEQLLETWTTAYAAVVNG